MKTDLTKVFLIYTSLISFISINGCSLNARVTDLEVCPASAPTRFVDNGDGTICDNKTGLMWEKKNAEDGVSDYSNPRDVDNTYTWTATADGDFRNRDGTMFTDFLARLNNTVASSMSDIPFAGHTDWRIPTSWELQTILDCSFGSTCIDPIFGPTAARGYHSTTSVTGRPAESWSVLFFGGLLVDSDINDNPGHVRAVRGGR